jgi:hypothetical protein
MMPSPETIKKRAYEIYVARGCEEGDALDDWLAAEMQLIFEMNWPQRTRVHFSQQRVGDSLLP